MTAREKTLATGLAVLLGLAGSAGVLYLFALEPWKSAEDRVLAAQALFDEKNRELEREQAQIAALYKVNPRLRQYNKISLPPRDPSLKRGQVMTEEQKRKHLNRLQVDYEAYLDQLLRRHKFKPDTIVITPRQIEKQATAKGKQAPLYERLSFAVVARGDLDSVSKMLEEFHRTPLLHHVRNITVDLANANRGGGKSKDAGDGALDLKMTVEALLVNGAEDRQTLIPPKLTSPLVVLASDGRDYSLMTKKNMFTGIKPPPVPVREKKEERKRPREPEEDVLRFVKLTMLSYDPDRSRWEATLYDQARGGAEKKLNTRVLRDLTIYDRYDEPTLEAKVVHIDESQLIFQRLTDKKFYRLRCGDFLYPAVKEPLSASEVKALGLDR